MLLRIASMPRKYLLFILLLVIESTAAALAQETTSATTSGIASAKSVSGRSIADPASTSIEHWDKLSLRDNDLHPNPPAVGQTDRFPEFTRELLRVQWRDGDPIDLYIVRPIGVSKPPVVIYLYGYPSEATRFLDYEFCKTVTQRGMAAVGFSSMLTGQRYHDVPMKEWFVSDLQRSLAGTAHDVQMVLNYLQERGDFDLSHTGIFGEGSGGTIALLSASVDPRIKAVDVLNPWGDWTDWLAESRIVPDAERPNYLKPEFLQSIAPFDPVAILPRLGGTPLRVQQTLWDFSRTPEASSKRIAAALPSTAELIQYKDKRDYLERAGTHGKLLDWLSGHLTAGPTDK